MPDPFSLPSAQHPNGVSATPRHSVASPMQSVPVSMAPAFLRRPAQALARFALALVLAGPWMAAPVHSQGSGAAPGVPADTKAGAGAEAKPAVDPKAGGDPKAGAEKRSQCIGCHAIPGYKASFPKVYSVPMIAGQNAKYLEAALLAYRKGDRPHPTMRGIAWSLSDTDIADLAAYYAGR